jgi:hypothetical protein
MRNLITKNMKTLHFNAAGEYTGYSVNHTSVTEKVFGVLAGLALTGASAAVTFIVGNVAMPKAIEKYMEKQQANAKTNNNSNEFEDPK